MAEYILGQHLKSLKGGGIPVKAIHIKQECGEQSKSLAGRKSNTVLLLLDSQNRQHTIWKKHR